MVIKETLILLRSHVHTRQWRTELTHRLKVSVFTFNSKALINHSQMTPTAIQNIFKDADHWCSVLCHSSLISILFRISETYRGGSLVRTLIEYRSSKTLLFCSKKYSIFRRCWQSWRTIFIAILRRITGQLVENLFFTAPETPVCSDYVCLVLLFVNYS